MMTTKTDVIDWSFYVKFQIAHCGGSFGCAPGCDAGGREFQSDKDDKPEVPYHNSLNVDNSVGR